MELFVEFYVACNPPLQPHGVGEVCNKLKQSHYAGAVKEILYEADEPWFKLITAKQDQKNVTRCIQDILLEILESDCDLRRPLNTVAQDVDIVQDIDVRPNARVLPWVMIQDEECGNIHRQSLNDWQFPEGFRSFPSKEVWSRLEDGDSWDLDWLLGSLEPWSDVGAPTCPQSLKALLGCEITFNFRSTRLYLAAEKPSQTAAAVRKLEALVHIAKHECHSINHVALTNGPESKFSFKWLSHLGLARSTYYHQFDGDMDNNIQMMKSAVTIWACKNDGGGQPVHDTWWNLKKPTLKPEAVEKFKVFAQYKYPSKEAQRSNKRRPRGPGNNAKFTFTGCTAAHIEFDQNSRPSPRPKRNQRTLSSDNVRPQDDLEDPISFEALTAVVKLPGNPIVEDLISFDSLTSSYSNNASTRSFEMPALGSPADQLDLLTADDVREAPGLQEPLVSKGTQRKASFRKKSASSFPELESSMATQSAMLRGAPGYVSAKIRMGRSLIVNLHQSEVDIGCGPQYQQETMPAHLKGLGPTNLRFSTAISTIGKDAQHVADLRSNGELACVMTGIVVTYEIKCIVNGEELFIQIDADDFSFRCVDREIQVAATFVHCPNRTWDLQACMARRTNLTKFQEVREFGQTVCNSLIVTRDKNGGPVLDMFARDQSGRSVESVRIRHVARYQHKDAGSAHLCIEMKQDLSAGEVIFDRRKWATPKQRDRDQARPSSWYEAYVASDVAQELFDENVGLNIGCLTSWTVNNLQEEGVFCDMCQIAVSMVKQLDDVGMYNDNGLDIRGGNALQFTKTSQNLQRKKGDYQYW